MTKDPETQEFMMIIQFADQGNLRHVLSSNFNNILWKDKIKLLYYLTDDLKSLHKLGYFHKDFHSGNILQDGSNSYISDFGLSGVPDQQMNKNQKVKYVEYYHILLQKF